MHVEGISNGVDMASHEAKGKAAMEECDKGRNKNLNHRKSNIQDIIKTTNITKVGI